MSYATERVAILRRNLTAIQAAITSAWTAYASLVATENESYEFDSGEGKQKTKRRSLDEILNNIERLQAEEMSIVNELNGMGIVSMRVRRDR